MASRRDTRLGDNSADQRGTSSFAESVPSSKEADVLKAIPLPDGPAPSWASIDYVPPPTGHFLPPSPGHGQILEGYEQGQGQSQDQEQIQRERRPAAQPPPRPPGQAHQGSVIASAAPELRDLKAEAASFLPASVRNKRHR